MSKRSTSRGLAWALTLAMGLAACGSEEVPTGAGTTPMVPTAEQREQTEDALAVTEPPVIERLEIVPSEILAGREIRVVTDVSDPDGGPLHITYVWSRNGVEVARSKQPSMTFQDLEKGDSILLEATASDGRNESAPMRLRASVGNRPPTLTKLELEPTQDIRAGMTVKATPYAEDPDNDRLSFVYAWSVNGAERGSERSFDTEGLRRGDKLSLAVSASDGERKSKPYTIETVLGNTPPTIRSAGEKPIASLYRHKFEAKDMDGDRNLRFYLETGPAGMTMDAITGMLSWKPDEAQAGRHDVVVGVKDGNGEGTTFSFAVTVATQPADSPPAAPAN
ncbi:MAG: hypothetical protein CL910_19600, partial [Deltaproteobacteria bacterium]|nr:hypothetical protein [Deltaproteobacteria bacterium]